MFKILATLKSFCVKRYYLIQKLDLVVERVYFPYVLAIGFKNLVSHTEQKKCGAHGTLIF